jgi:hypothetical protein
MAKKSAGGAGLPRAKQCREPATRANKLRQRHCCQGIGMCPSASVHVAQRVQKQRGQAARLPPQQNCVRYPFPSRVNFAGSFHAHSHGPTILALPSRQSMLCRTCVWISSLADSPVWRPSQRRPKLRIPRLAVLIRVGGRLGGNSPSWRAS